MDACHEVSALSDSLPFLSQHTWARVRWRGAEEAPQLLALWEISCLKGSRTVKFLVSLLLGEF